jgi:hypothetical protein
VHAERSEKGCTDSSLMSGGHYSGQILLDKLELYCIYIALLNNLAGHSGGHFRRQNLV